MMQEMSNQNPGQSAGNSGSGSVYADQSPAYPSQQSMVMPNQPPVYPSQESMVAPSQTPMYPSQQSMVTPSQAPVYQSQQSMVTPSQAPVYQSQQSMVTPSQSPAYPGQQSMVAPSQSSVYPGQSNGYPAQSPGYPAQIPGYPAQSAGYPAAPIPHPSAPPQSPISTGLLSDIVAGAIHDAFLLGWSLVELKSRIEIQVLDVEAAAIARHAAQGAASTTNTGGTTAQSGDQAHHALSRVEALLSEVRQMTQGAVAQLLPAQSTGSACQTSEWRGAFNRIAALQNKRFANSSTIGSMYEPPGPASLPYLYPSPDYADVGASNSADKLGQFHLYDVTRRTLNCLTLLYTNLDDSLIPDTLGGFRRQLVQNILNPGSQSTTTPVNIVSQDVLQASQNDDGTGDIAAEPPEPSQDDVDKAIKILSGFAIGFLEAWDAYLRENYYVGGGLQNNELEVVAYEAGHSIALLVWSVSLKITPVENALKFASTNSNVTATGTQEQQNEGNSQGASNNVIEQLKTALTTAWTNIFNERDIIHIQHQITALKTALDNAYYATNKNAQPPATGAVLVRPDLQLPSNALHAVKHSLDYWQMGVSWTCNNTIGSSQSQAPANQGVGSLASIVGGAGTAESSRSQAPTNQGGASTVGGASTAPTAAANPLASLWQPWEWSQTLRLALIQQADVWQSLVLCQQSLHSFAIQSVTQKILNNFMQTFQQVAVQGLFQTAQGTAQEVGTAANQVKQVTKEIVHGYRPILIAVLVPIGVILAVLIALVLLLPNLGNEIKGSLATLLALAGSTGIYIVNKLKQTSSSIPGEQTAAAEVSEKAGALAQSVPNLFEHFSTMLGSAGSTMMTSFEHGYEQIMIEFDSLNHNVSVAFPLIEFFTMNTDKFKEEIADSFTFLTKIVWTDEERAAEIQHIAQAAFGPIGAFVGTHLELLKLGGSGPATSK